MILTLGAWHITLMAIGFVVVSLFMLMVVLIQRPKGGGLAGAFGALAERPPRLAPRPAIF